MVVPWFFSLGVVLGGFIVFRRMSSVRTYFILLSIVFLMFLAGGVTGLNLYYDFLVTGEVTTLFVKLVNNIAFGGFVGMVLGFYYNLALTEKKRAIESKRTNELLQSLLTHDLKNKLQVVLGNLDLLNEKTGIGGRKEIEVSRENLHDLLDIADKVRKHSDAPTKPQRVDIYELREMVLDAVDEFNEDLDISISHIESDSLFYAGNLFKDVFRALLENSVEHGDADEVCIEFRELSDKLIIILEDDGVGITNLEKDNVFDIGYTDTSSSAGFGLYLSKKVIEDYGGSIQFEGPGSLGGARFVIELKKTV